MLLAIDNDPRDYAWGRRGAISRLLGRVPTDAIEAELWLGAHHGSPTRVVDPAAVDGAADLVEAVAAIPELTGGTGRVPFLLKVIAPASPLSLQAHPTAEQARAGFEREESAGIALDAFERNYKDPYPKPELIVAVEDGYEALAGLRPVQDAVAALHRLAAGHAVSDGDAEVILGLAAALERADDLPGAIARLLRCEAATDAEPGVDDVIAAVTRAVLADAAGFPVQARIAHEYPGDPGIVISLLLHHVTLQRGESVYLPAGNLHAYLDGVGIELMTASDNVLRGGLTPKHVDVPELLAVLDASPRPVPWLAPTPLPGGGVEYRPDDPDAGFGLSWIEGDATLPLTGPAIALCLDGAFTIVGDESTLPLPRGAAAYASPGEGTLRITGSGLVVVAR
jgi:mannose-6-phosphate isomerase